MKNLILRRPLMLVFAVLMGIGFFLHLAGIKLYSETSLDKAFNGKATRICAVGEVENITAGSGGEKMFLKDCSVDITDTKSKDLFANGLLVYGEDFKEHYPGEIIKITGILKAFEKPDNPGEFDRFSYYRARGADYSITAEKAEHIGESGLCFLKKILYKCRKSLEASISDLSEDVDEAGIFKAFFLGDKSGLSDGTYEILQLGGAAHILAISGLHLSLLAGLLLQALQKAGLGKLGASVTADIVLLLYVIMLDGSISAWRAYIMFSVSVFAKLAGRTYDLLSALGLAGILIIASRPLYIIDPAFLLSFSSVFAVGAVYPAVKSALFLQDKRQSKIKGKVIDAVLISASVQMTTLPLSAYNYYYFCPYGILVNLAVMPFLSFALISVILGAFFGLASSLAGTFFAGVAHYFFKGLMSLCVFFSELPGAAVLTGKPEWWQVAVYYAALIFALRFALGKRKAGGRMRLFGRLSFALLAAAPALLFHFPCGPSLNALYVGQGDCAVLIDDSNEAVIIDCGSSDKKDVAKSVILPFLRSQGVRNVSAVLLSHSDADHINGFEGLAKDRIVRIKNVIIPAGGSGDEWKEIKKAAQSEKILFNTVSQGDSISFGSFRFFVLSPAAETAKNADKNESSMVIRLDTGSFSALFTGDIGKETEERLIKDFGELLDTDYLKCPHHGSKYSSSEAFIKAVSPAAVTVSAGRNNRYGHPSDETLKRLSWAGCSIFRTDTAGAVITELSGSGFIISSFRS